MSPPKGGHGHSGGRSMREPGYADLGFRYRATKRGEVFVHHRGRLATTLRGGAAADFLQEVEGVDTVEQQHIMARVTGNYRRASLIFATRDWLEPRARPSAL